MKDLKNKVRIENIQEYVYNFMWGVIATGLGMGLIWGVIYVGRNYPEQFFMMLAAGAVGCLVPFVLEVGKKVRNKWKN